MKLFHTHGLRQNKGTFGCGHTALKCRAKKLLQRIVTGCGYLFQKAIGFAPSVFTRKFRKQTREAVNGRDVTRDGIRKRHCTFEIGHAFVRLRRVFGFVFGIFLTGSPFCRKNRKIRIYKRPEVCYTSGRMVCHTIKAAQRLERRV